jgi:menaquinone-dependent protoporphyrinogen oxidase
LGLEQICRFVSITGTDEDSMARRTGETSGGGRVLVAYASRFGSTVGVAEAIADVLRDGGATADVRAVTDTAGPGGYDAAVIGGPIHYDRWTRDAARFVTAHRGTLCAMPVAFFFTCLTLSDPGDKARSQANAYGKAIAERFPPIAPVAVGGFAGAMDFAAFPFYVRPLVRTMFAYLRVKEGDYRDWAAIRDWAAAVRPELTARAGVRQSSP